MDLNNDDFPLIITELIVVFTIGFGAMSFMDGFSGYNQIKMDLKDGDLTTFQTPQGINCFTVMLFDLKNTGATYKRAMTIIFHDFPIT